MRQGSRLGRIVRGAFATRGASSRAKGSGAPAPRLLLAVAAALALTLVLGVALAGATAPAVSIEPAANVEFSTADVAGEVNPEDKETSYHFEYIADAQFEENVANLQPPFQGATEVGFDSLPENGGLTPVSEALTNLTPATTYHLRLFAENGDGAETAETATFETKGPVTAPTVAGVASSAVLYTTAHVSGEVTAGNADPAFNATTCRFEFISDAAYHQNVDNGEPGFQNAPSESCDVEPSGAAPTAVGADLTGLGSNATYHLRLLAENSGGQSSALGPNFETEPVAKPVLTTPAISAIAPSGAHFDAEVDPNAPDEALSPAQEAAWATEWHFDCTPSCDVSPTGEQPLAAGHEPKPVSADAGNLEPNTEYTVTLHASNAGGERTASEAFTTGALAPGVAAGTNTPLDDTTTRVRAYVNPHNDPITTCVFEYGPTTSYGKSIPCAHNPAGGNQPVEVSADVPGLDPGAGYHFQVKATNGAGTTPSEDSVFGTFQAPAPESCPNQARREEQRSTALPDCRAYEMVSPPDKGGSDVRLDSTRTRAAVQGGAVAFTSLGAFGDAVGMGATADYLAQRNDTPGTQGWSTHGLNPQHDAQSFVGVVSGGMDPGYVAMSPDLAHGIYKVMFPLSDDPMTANVGKLYVRDDLSSPGGGTYQLVTTCPACASPLLLSSTGSQQVPTFDGASSDFGHVLFRSRFALTSDAPLSGQPLTYEWDHGTLRLVGILPDGTPAASSISGSAQEAYYKINPISGDGSRAFFSVPAASDPTGTDQLYMRVNHSSTVRISAPEQAVPSPPGSARFEAATPNGSKVFFTSTAPLIDGPAGALYMYDTTVPDNEDNLTSVEVDHESADPGDIEGVIGTSDDGSYVYFVAQGQLVAGRPVLGSGYGIYLAHNGVVTYIGGVGKSGAGVDANVRTQWGILTQQARVTPDGHHLLFASYRGGSLTGYDHGNSCSEDQGGSGGGGCRELYLYSADQNSLACVSCRPGGVAATSDASTVTRVGTGGGTVSQYLDHALSNDGSRVFFSSGDRLLEGDHNGASDAYQYDAGTGETHLISSGKDESSSYFLDASPDGRDLFFATHERLLGWDADNSTDLYDARAGGGLPEPPPGPAAACSGDSCQGAQTAPPPVVSPASGSAAGPVNPRPRRPRKPRKPRGKHHHKRAADHNRRASR